MADLHPIFSNWRIPRSTQKSWTWTIASFTTPCQYIKKQHRSLHITITYIYMYISLSTNQTIKYIYWLVVEPPLWIIWKSVRMIIHKIWKHKTCSKPPTRHGYDLC
jgi:CRISPR/Cas system endoribonuclease Cas6 (RAMP superfamily)